MSVISVSMQAPPTATPGNVERNSTPAENVASVAPAKATAPAETAQTGSASRAEVEKAVEAVQKFTQPIASNLQFTIDEDTGIRVIKVIDTSTKEVIRQMPSEEMLQIAQALDRLQGLLIQSKA